MNIRKTNKSGFAVIESVLILIIIAAVIGVGGYVINQKDSIKSSVGTSTSSTDTSATKDTEDKYSSATKLQVVNSTNSDISKLISDESDTEFNLDKSSDSDALIKINDSNKAASEIGDAYNENDL